MTQKNQVYFEISEFANDIIKEKNNRNLTYKDMSMEIGCTVAVLKNLFHSCRCSVDTLVSLCAWANLDPRKYFIVYPYE